LPLTVGGVAVTVVITDESAKLNLNTAPESNLRTLIQIATGMDQARAETLAQAISAWRNGSLTKPAAASIRAAYIAAGKRYAPPFEPFRSLDELGLVLGMNPEILQRLTPHLSLYALDAGSAADPLVAEARAIAGPAPAAPPWPRVVAIDALAYGAHGTAFRRQAVVRLDPGRKPVYTILDWSHRWGPMPADKFTKN
ncbi:MAG TPA: hypothetical protein VL574_01310, partial [Stellaceae bacterium]|nr:hypothetical protein [Stellaceae bacterium]